MKKPPIILKKVRVHNLKEVDLELEANELIVFTGVSGSGKSSLAFDTIYVEGQRRYIESLSTAARHHLTEMTKPDVEFVSGLSPTISIEQKTAGKNPRSLIATMTEIYDYMRVLWARVGIPHCPVSGESVLPQSKEHILHNLAKLPRQTSFAILAPFARNKKGEFKDELEHFVRKGFTRVRIDNRFVDLSETIALDRKVAHDIDIVIDRLELQKESSRLKEAVTLALTFGPSLIALDLTTDQEYFFSTASYSPKSGLSYPPLQPQDFSFNSPSGMCPHCHGLGIVQEFDLDRIIDPEKSIEQDCCIIASSYQTVRYGNIYDNLARLYHFDVKTAWKKLSEKAQKVFLHGTDKKWTQMHFVHPTREASWTEYVAWRGVLWEAKSRYAEAASEGYRAKMEKLMRLQSCPTCQGSRLKSYPAATKLGDKCIHDITAMTIEDALHFFSSLALNEAENIIAEELINEIQRRLYFLVDVGLGYLSLDRTAPTLSGGESQRVRLASQVGSGLVGVTYVLDEPSIGLHPRDNDKLIATLKTLRDRGNTVIVVEHDEDTILAADRIVDFGPGPGTLGGTILFNGSPNDLKKVKNSPTRDYLLGIKQIAIPEKRRKSKKELIVKKASHHNLKGIDLKMPLGCFVAITGVSGSGKSSLISDILYPALANELHGAEMAVGEHQSIEGIEQIDKVIAIDQSPIGRNPRSNPATYIKVFDEIRKLYAQLPEAKMRGYSAARFSFNVRQGACSECRGMGVVRVDMDFMEDQFVSCPVCKNQRFDAETLSIYFKGKNMHDVLAMTAQEALTFFDKVPAIGQKLQVLNQVGMGYITLGQSSTTLSGGEAQRVKLAKELARPPSGKTLYILDEPTTGLHYQDIEALLSLLHALVDRGNTVLVIEHNMEVVKTADWVVDLGPEGGAAGGKIVAEGTPEKLAKLATPTGKALKAMLCKEPPSLKKKEGQKSVHIDTIEVMGAAQNNLKNLNITIPRGQMTICTGPSGSGKSSFAFETVYAEGQRRYIESLSAYARQFVEQCPKPKFTSIEGLSAAVAIEQKTQAGNPRSTVGTLTEIYDYLRILYAHVGQAFDPQSGEKIESITKEFVVQKLFESMKGALVTLCAPYELGKENFEDLIRRFATLGYLRLRLNGHMVELDEPIDFDKKRKNEIALVIDRVRISEDNQKRLAEAIEQAVKISGSQVLVIDEKGNEQLFNLAFAAPSSGRSFQRLTPHSFSFNSSEGMCLECQGLGLQYGARFIDSELMKLSSLELITIFMSYTPKLIEKLFKAKKIDILKPLSELKAEEFAFVLQGSSEWFKGNNFHYQWLGITTLLAKAAKNAKSAIKTPLTQLLDQIDCPACKGGRLNALASHVQINKLTLPELSHLPIDQMAHFIRTLSLSTEDRKVLSEVIRQIEGRIKFLLNVGLHYLSLDRRSHTLSNGETQRIRLARALGSRLTGVLYVLDEPTVGLHPRDNVKLNQALKELKELGNTLLLVEHDPMTVKNGDLILDFGPAAGRHGGQLMAMGTFKQILRDPNSLTGAYLSGREKIALPRTPRTIKKHFEIKGARVFNLKNLDLKIGIGLFSCLTGVSGSGKSTLMHEVIRPWAERAIEREEPFNKLIVIDQNPIGHTVRSDVGSYVDLLDPLRSFYSALPAALARGLQPRHFSYNHRKGMCTHCYGMGYRKVELLFLAPVRVSCEMCDGLRLNPLSLEVSYQGRNFGQLLQLSIEEIGTLFGFIPKVKRITETLISVGLAYLALGQQMPSLSSGEAQRMKLSRELAKRGTGKTLYLLDEPTTGQHPDDIRKLLLLLQQLVDKGNTLIAIEHNMDFIRQADWIFDLGPEGGAEGGQLVAAGTPEEISRHPTSYTGQFLREKF